MRVDGGGCRKNHSAKDSSETHVWPEAPGTLPSTRRILVWHESAVEQLHDMKYILVGAVEGSSGAELQETARIGGGKDLCPGGLCVAHFFGEQLELRFGLGDVVGSRRAAANFRVRQLHKVEMRNGGEHLSRRVADLLSMQQMAGVLISDAAAQRVKFGG